MKNFNSWSGITSHGARRKLSAGDYEYVRKMAYKKFQIFWLYDHGFGMADIFQAMEEAALEISSEGEDIYSGSLCVAFEEFGLGSGSIYPCYDEFLTAEYMDAGLMYNLLTENEFEVYAKERGFNAVEFRRKAEAICVETPHGTIRATRKGDTEYPGIELEFLSKNGKDQDCGPGAMMEYHPHYQGIDHENDYSQEKVVMWIYPKERFQDDPSTGFEME